MCAVLFEQSDKGQLQRATASRRFPVQKLTGTLFLKLFGTIAGDLRAPYRRAAYVVSCGAFRRHETVLLHRLHPLFIDRAVFTGYDQQMSIFQPSLRRRRPHEEIAWKARHFGKIWTPLAVGTAPSSRQRQVGDRALALQLRDHFVFAMRLGIYDEPAQDMRIYALSFPNDVKICVLRMASSLGRDYAGTEAMHLTSALDVDV